jgi:trehalose-6-phosphate synthase
LSSGGLVSALSGLFKEMKFKWIGWPGFSVQSEEEKNEVYFFEIDSCWTRRNWLRTGVFGQSNRRHALQRLLKQVKSILT